MYLCCLAPVRAQQAEDPLYTLMLGEFALQEGATLEAAELYARAADLAADPQLAERATRLALHAGKSDLAARGLERWRQLDADAESLPQLELSLALAEGDQQRALRALEVLLRQADGWKSAIQAVATEPKSLVARALVVQMLKRDDVLSRLDALLALGGLAERMQLEGLLHQVGELAVKHHPMVARAWLWKAESERKRGDFALAQRAVETALALPDIDDEMRLAAAGILSSLGDPAAAAAALAAGEQTPATLAGRAAFLARAEDDAGLEALYAELQAAPEPGDAERTYLLGQLAELLERDAEAAAWYGQVPAGEKGDQAQLRMAVLAEKGGDLASALKQLHGLQSSDSDDGTLLIDAFLLEAELLGKNDQRERALDAYDRGLATFEDEARLLYGRALLLESLDRLDESESDLRRILALDPESAEALNALGYTLADRTDRLDEAYALIRKALHKQPDNPAVIDSMGWVLFRMGRVEEALPHLRRAFELQRDAEVAAHLGEALWANGKHDEARNVWRLGQEIDPDNRAIRRVQSTYLQQP